MLKQYELMTWNEFVEARDNGDIFVLTVGAIEQHGAHMPMGVDHFLPYELVKQKLSERYNIVLLPPIYYGYRSQTVIGGGDKYPGTLRMSSESVCYPVRDICLELFRHGVKRLIIANGHLENKGYLVEGVEKALAEFKGDVPTKILLLEWSAYVKDETLNKIFDGNFPGWDPEHAGVLETSLMMVLCPELVRLDKIPDESAKRYIKYTVWPASDDLVTVNGALASAKNSSVENGQLMLKDALEGMYRDIDIEFFT